MLRALPLADENGDEERRQSEIQTLGVDLQAAAQQSAQRSARNPVNLVEQGDEGHEPALVDAGRRVGRAVDGEGFVAHAEDKIEFFPAQPFEFFQHGQAVKKMAGVDHERHQEAIQRVEGAEQHGYEHELHGAGENQRAGEKRIPGREALAANIKAVGKP